MSSKKTTNTTSSGTQYQSTTPTVPDWISNPTQQMAGTIGNLLQQGSGAYTPGESDLQRQAVAGAAGLTPSGYYDQAGGVLSNLPQVTTGGSIANITNGGAIDPITGQSVLTGLDSYMSPYLKDVVNSTLADYDYQSGQTQAANAAAAARTNAFGGSRYGVQSAQTAADLARGRATTEAGLLNQGYTQAAGMSEADTARRQAAALANQQAQEFTAGQNLTAAQANQAAQEFMAGQTMGASQANQAAALQKAGLLTGLGTAQDTSARANVALQDQIGAQQTDLENAIRQYPMQFQAQLESLLSGLNPQMYVGSSGYGGNTSKSTSTTVSDPGILGGLGMGLSALSMLNPATAGASSLFSSFRQSPMQSFAQYGNQPD